MATNATVDQLREIWETPQGDTQLKVWLAIAIELVDDMLAQSGYSAARMTHIALNLAAHFGSAITPSTSRERVGRDYEMERTGKFGELLKSTVYGQTVLTLDTSGILATAGQKRLRIRLVLPSGDKNRSS